MPKRLAGTMYQEGMKIPHLNVGPYHVITNRYNWYKPWKWFVR
jgi:hypothetical protein